MAGGLQTLANLLGVVDANGALRVSLSGSFVGQLLGEVSATVPAYSFAGDTNTGYGASAADTLALFAGGTTPRVTVTATAVTSTLPIVFSAAGLSSVGASSTLGVSITSADGGSYFRVFNGEVQVNSASLGFANGGTTDVSLTRGAADLLQLAQDDNLSLVRGYIQGFEMTAPSAPAANGGRMFFQDNGGGKTQLMVIFNSGAAQQIAIEP